MRLLSVLLRGLPFSPWPTSQQRLSLVDAGRSLSGCFSSHSPRHLLHDLRACSELAPASGFFRGAARIVHPSGGREVTHTHGGSTASLPNGRVLIGPWPTLGTSGCPRVEFPLAAIVVAPVDDQITTRPVRSTVWLPPETS